MGASYRSLKYILVLSSLMMVAAIVYIVEKNESEHVDGDQNFSISAPSSVSTPESSKASFFQNAAANPHFEAVDEKGQPYTIRATSAAARDKEGMIDLEKPSYAIDLNDKTHLSITSSKGFLDQDHKKLTLEGDVVVQYGKDVTFKMPYVLVHLKDGHAFGDQSIKARGEKIAIDAGRFEIYNKGDKIVLTDNPVLHFRSPK